MDVDSRVALATSSDFTGTIEAVDRGIYTVRFDVGGRGWLQQSHLVEIDAPQPKRTTHMNKGSHVALRAFPTITGEVETIDGIYAVVRHADGLTTRYEVGDLVEITDLSLPDKSWPPPGLETKDPAP